MNSKYSMQIVWSDEDAAFLVSVPELPGCMADGATPQEAIEAAQEVVQQWIHTAEDLGRPVPPPLTADDYATMAKEFRSRIQAEVKRQVEEAVGRVLKEIPHLAMLSKDPADFWKER